jgi:hypothetical protein
LVAEHLSDPGSARSAAFGFARALAAQPVIESRVQVPLAMLQAVRV